MKVQVLKRVMLDKVRDVNEIVDIDKDIANGLIATGVVKAVEEVKEIKEIKPIKKVLKK